MNLLFLHGPPAAGKLTVARTILERVDGRLFDNHVSIDFARALFEFGTEPFWDLVDEVRHLAVEKAARSDIPLLLFTCCYSDPVDRPQLERFEATLHRHGGALLPAYLHCSPRTLHARIGAPDRIERQKLSSPEGLDKALKHWNLVPVPRNNCVSIDTDRLSPHEAADAIIGHFNILHLNNEAGNR